MTDQSGQLFAVALIVIGLAFLLGVILKHIKAFVFFFGFVIFVTIVIWTFGPSVSVLLTETRQAALESTYLALTPTATPTITPTPMPTHTLVPVATTETASQYIWEEPTQDTPAIKWLFKDTPWGIILVISGIVLLAVVLALLFFRGDKTPAGGES